MKLLTNPFFVKLKGWFTPPVFEDQDKTLMARNSFALAIVGITTSIFIFIFFLLFAPANHFRLLVIGASIFFSYLPIVFLRKGYVPAVILFQASIIWIGVVSTAISTGGVRSIGFIGGTIAALLIMGIALEWKSTFFFIAISIAAAGILAWAETRGYINTTTIESPIVLVATYASFLFVLAGLLYVTYRNVTQALARANKELLERQRAEARLRGLVENSPATMLEINRKSEIIFTNSNPELVLGLNVTHFLEPEDRAWVGQLVEQVFETGESKTIEVKVNVPRGTLRWNSISFGPVMNGDEITSLVIIATNINAQKEAELLVRQRAEQLATIVEIGHAVSTLRDLDSILNIIYQQVQRIAPVDAFLVSLYDKEKDRLSFPLTIDEGVRYDETDIPLHATSRLAKVITSGQPYRLHRTHEEIIEAEKDASGMGNYKRRSGSLLYIPLWDANEIIGVLSIQSYSLNAYPDELVETLVGIADQVAIAIQNARLYMNVRQELAERKVVEEKISKTVNQLAVLNEIGRAIYEITDLHSVLEIVRQQLEKVVEFDFYSVWIFKDPARPIATFLAVYEDGQYWSEPDFELAVEDEAHQVFVTGNSVLHLLTEQEIELEAKSPPTHLIGVPTKSTNSLIYVPLKKRGQTIGTLSLQRYQPNSYTLEHLKQVEAVAVQVSVALENARLFSDLQRELAERQRAEAQVRELNTALEHRVAERTAQLEFANRELEAFSFSVSHDLRAPLRHINSFAKIIKTDFADGMEPMARNYLEKVLTAGDRMNHLIDDLLDFSRLTRRPLHKQETDLRAVVVTVIESLAPETAGRQIEWIISDLPAATVDPTLIQPAYANLIGNAVKYTSKRQQARIEIGCENQAGEPVYYVRDNGAGFDMTYASKLFGVFQRLHREDEFEGTGIGLATVQRIITRHGGHIWAEAEPDKGATFYFTLEKTA